MESDDVARIGFKAAQRGVVVVTAATPALKALYALLGVAPRRLVGAALSQVRRNLDVR